MFCCDSLKGPEPDITKERLISTPTRRNKILHVKKTVLAHQPAYGDDDDASETQYDVDEASTHGRGMESKRCKSDQCQNPPYVEGKLYYI